MLKVPENNSKTGKGANDTAPLLFRQASVGLSEYFAFYNGERPHRLLGQQKQEQQQNQKQNLGSAVQLREKLNVQLRLTVFLS